MPVAPRTVVGAARDMNWEAIGSASELIGAAATVVTLAYLAIQIRHSTRAARATSYQAAMASIAEWTRTTGSDPSLAVLFHRGIRDTRALSEQERIQFGYLLLSLVRNFENLYFQFRNGTLDEENWDPWASRIERTFASPGSRLWWKEQAPAFSMAFRKFVDEVAAQPGRAGGSRSRRSLEGP
jgi:hypothetical protein